LTRFLRTGVVAGVVAGAVLALVLIALGEDVIGRAVAREAASAHDHDEMFTRSTQTAGGVLGALFYGTSLGVLFATVFAVLRHRLHLVSDFRRAALVAAAGWTGAVLVPFVLYPPNPPGVGSSGSVDDRTIQYLIAVLWGLVSVYTAARVARQLQRAQRTEPVIAAVALTIFAALLVLAALVLPEPASANDVPADLVWSFRLRSLAGTSACWTVLGIVFGALTQRNTAPELVDA